jgi:subtilisin family serine protease
MTDRFRRPRRNLAITLLGALTVAALFAAPAATAGDATTGQYIVVLKDTTTAAADLAARPGVRPLQLYRHAFNGYAASLTAAQLAAVHASANVVAVVPNRTRRMIDPPASGLQVTSASAAKPSPQPAQVPTFGIRRVGGLQSPTARIDNKDDPMPVDIAILDSGIDTHHPDLRVSGGKNCAGDGGGFADVSYHGTFVAGVAAAIDNAIGRVGSAPGARLWSVRVVDAQGIITDAAVLCGIDWVTEHAERIEVANMSLGGEGADTGNCGRNASGQIVDVFHWAICRSTQHGVTYVVIAGNDEVDTAGVIPAAYDEVITVSGFADNDGQPGGFGGPLTSCSSGAGEVDDQFASFSNFGADVDLAAPAVCVGSTYPGGLYASDSGTSYAAPMVAGAAALYLVNHPGASPAQVRTALVSLAEPGPITGDPDSYPEGIVNLSHL